MAEVLTEAGLLPGALQKNAGLKFVCAPAALRVETTSTVLTRDAAVGDILNIPVNHFEGNYTCSPETLAELRSDDRVVLRYVDNPNGSVGGIAGLCDPTGRVLGLMPHPERFIHATQHPQWTRRRGTVSPEAEGDGAQLFRNAIHYFG